MNEDLKEYYSGIIARIDPESASYGFLKKEWESSLEKLEETVEQGYQNIGSGTQGEDIFYKILDSEFQVLEERRLENTYQIKAGLEEVKILGERIRQHFNRGYDKPELIGYLRAADKKSQRYFRQKEQLPSENPYISHFGGWNNALWHAGIETQEQLDKEELEDQLRRKTHELNRNRDLLIETPTAKQIEEDPSLHNKSEFQQRFGSIEEAFRSANLGYIRKLEKEHLKWHQIIYEPHSKIIELRDRHTGIRLE